MELLKKVTWEEYIGTTIGELTKSLPAETLCNTYIYTNTAREICIVLKPDRHEVPDDYLVGYGYLTHNDD